MRLVEDVSGKIDMRDGGTSSCSPHRFTLTNPQRAQSLWGMRRGRSHWREDRPSYHSPEREWWRGLNQAKKRRGIKAAAPALNLLDPEWGSPGWAALLSPSSTRRRNPNLWRFQKQETKLQHRNRTPQRDRVCAGAGSLELLVVLTQGWMELKTRQNGHQPGNVWVFGRRLLMVQCFNHQFLQLENNRQRIDPGVGRWATHIVNFHFFQLHKSEVKKYTRHQWCHLDLQSVPWEAERGALTFNHVFT